jgi:hypothetical protein
VTDSKKPTREDLDRLLEATREDETLKGVNIHELIELARRGLHAVGGELLLDPIDIRGVIGNGVPTSPRGKQTTIAWKRLVMRTVKQARGGQPLDSLVPRVVEIHFEFHRTNHGGHDCDAENFVKPTADAIAAGLFCPNDLEPEDVQRFGFDDTRVSVVPYRMDDPPAAPDEGVTVIIREA